MCSCCTQEAAPQRSWIKSTDPLINLDPAWVVLAWVQLFLVVERRRSWAKECQVCGAASLTHWYGKNAGVAIHIQAQMNGKNEDTHAIKE